MSGSIFQLPQNGGGSRSRPSAFGLQRHLQQQQSLYSLPYPQGIYPQGIYPQGTYQHPQHQFYVGPNVPFCFDYYGALQAYLDAQARTLAFYSLSFGLVPPPLRIIREISTELNEMLTSLELEDYAQNFALRNVLKLEDVTHFPSVYELKDDLVIPLVSAYKIIERTNVLLEAKARSSQPCGAGGSLPTQGSTSVRSPLGSNGAIPKSKQRSRLKGKGTGSLAGI